MKFDDLDKKMRPFETSHDHQVLPGIYMVARIDGRGFTRLTKELQDFDAPYDERFRDFMVETLKHLMQCGFNFIYGYTQSDELSLLVDFQDNTFGRKLRKWNSVLAGEASAKFSLLLGDMAVFDCRVCQLPNPALVTDYFRWRHEDAHRNALNGHCYWLLRREGLDAQGATQQLSGKSIADKNELLFQRGINFNEIPSWQKRGIGIYWEDYQKAGTDPRSGESRQVTRRRLTVDMELPLGNAYSDFIATFL